jgi:hypothetical protein
LLLGTGLTPPAPLKIEHGSLRLGQGRVHNGGSVALYLGRNLKCGWLAH